MQTASNSSQSSVATSDGGQGACELSVVLPCLNEVGTLAACIGKIRGSLDNSGVSYEIIVADNGSTDGSIELALKLGVRVVPVSVRGYGAALRAGFGQAAGRYMIMGDADDTYFLSASLALYRRAAESDADMSIAVRLGGDIEPGAMPFLHRYLGTPVLTKLINWFFGGQISDCNSGFRCLRKTSYEKWNVRADGMEFVCELSIRALKSGAKIVETRSGLARSSAPRVAHLRTWRDGMRNLLYILSERPQFLEFAGIITVTAASLLQVAAWITGPIAVFRLHIFDVHTQALLLLTAVTGAQLYVFSCYLYLGGVERSTRLTRKLIALDEGTLFFLLTGIFAAEGAVVGFIFVKWALSSFGGINLLNVLLILIHFLTIPALLALGLLGIHVFKKSGANSSGGI